MHLYMCSCFYNIYIYIYLHRKKKEREREREIVYFVAFNQRLWRTALGTLQKSCVIIIPLTLSLYRPQVLVSICASPANRQPARCHAHHGEIRRAPRARGGRRWRSTESHHTERCGGSACQGKKSGRDGKEICYWRVYIYICMRVFV